VCFNSGYRGRRLNRVAVGGKLKDIHELDDAETFKEFERRHYSDQIGSTASPASDTNTVTSLISDSNQRVSPTKLALEVLVLVWISSFCNLLYRENLQLFIPAHKPNTISISLAAQAAQ
jgi:hypothetical protein